MFCLTAVLRSDRKERCHFMILSLTRQQAKDNALPVAVQYEQNKRGLRYWKSRKILRLLNQGYPLLGTQGIYRRTPTGRLWNCAFSGGYSRFGLGIELMNWFVAYPFFNLLRKFLGLDGL